MIVPQAREVLLAVCVGITVYIALGVLIPTDNIMESFQSTSMKGTSARASQLALQARPSNDPSNFGSYHVGAKEVKAFKPTVGSHSDSGSPSSPTLLAGLPSMLLPGIAVVVVFGLLRLFRKPLLRFLGASPIEDQQPMYGSPYGYPPYGQDPRMMYGSGAPNPDVEASLQQLMQNATPEEAEQLRILAERMKSRTATGTTAARPASWVTPEPIPANPAEALSPEERRERARQKARSQAQVQVQDEVKASTQSWADKQMQAEKSMTSQAPVSGFGQLEDDQKLVAVASVVLTAFVVAEADARGYQTR